MSDELAYEMTRYDVHEVIAEIYGNFEEPRIQQQMLWLLDIMIANVRSKQRVHMSEKCVSLMKTIIDKREFLINQIGTSVKERFVPYKVVVPLSVRVFYREIGGKYLISAPTDEQVCAIIIFPKLFFNRNNIARLRPEGSLAALQCMELSILYTIIKGKRGLYRHIYQNLSYLIYKC